MDLECYGKKFGRLDKCRICEYVDYCRSAGDPALISNVSYDDVAYSEKIAQSPAKTQKTEDERPMFTLSQVCEIIRRIVDLEDSRIRDILRLKLANPDISLAQIGQKYEVSKQAIQQYEKRILRYCPELAPVIQNRPMYNKWRAHIHLPSKAPRAPFHDQMEFDFW